MWILINGEVREVEDESTLGSVVAAELPDVDARRGVAVAHNHQVVRRALWDDTALSEASRVEIVSAVQGG
ncbi:MAG: sulfur carrier protein ThiS [Propionibacteriales bacterium]|nr:sulfur carrier protein ThiS [Propionibacteriales bacterium]